MMAPLKALEMKHRRGEASEMPEDEADSAVIPGRRRSTYQNLAEYHTFLAEVKMNGLPPSTSTRGFLDDILPKNVPGSLYPDRQTRVILNHASAAQQEEPSDEAERESGWTPPNIAGPGPGLFRPSKIPSISA